MAAQTPAPAGLPAAQDFNLSALLDVAGKFITNELSLNTFSRYLTALAIVVVGIGLIWLIKDFLARRTAAWMAAQSSRHIDHELATETASALAPLLYLFPLMWALSTLAFSPGPRRIISFFILVLFITRTIRFLSSLAGLATDIYLRRQKESLDSTVGKALMPIIRVVFWAIGFTVFMDTLGFQVSSIVAGLGIAGVAVGLAAQATLSDFFAYLVIIMDRPFSIGDWIAAGDISGTVESIGLKTTRLRTLGGEVLVCPNGELTKQRIANFRAMRKRTRTFTFGVAYETPLEKLRAVPGIVREMADTIGIEIVRVHFTAFGDSSLNFEVMFSVRGRDLVAALDAQQQLFLELMERFAKENITFAYPTRTVYFAGGVAAPVPDLAPEAGREADSESV